MGSTTKEVNKPHVVCVPYPAQGHINPMFKLAKVLHQRGFHVTFVNTEYNHRRLIKTRGLKSLNENPGFRFEAIPDGLPQTDDTDATQDISLLSESVEKHCPEPFRRLLSRLNDSNSGDVVPPVSCVVSDGAMHFAIDAAEEIDVPIAMLWTASACASMAYIHFQHLIDRGLIPLKDESYLSNGFLDMVIDWIPGMNEIRLKDLPTFVRTTDPNDTLLRFCITCVSMSSRASAIIFNTFESLDRPILENFSSFFHRVFVVGPLHLIAENEALSASAGSSLWKEENECLKWLDSKEKNSVVYVNFGSIMVMSQEQLNELAWGLANSKKPFVWIIRSNLVNGDSAVLPPDFLEETRERCVLAGWCAQEQVLAHPAIGGFLTHCGWNSSLESLSAGVPVICWPFFADQQTNCKFLCCEWGIGMEIDSNTRRGKVEKVVRELMDGEKGKEMRNKALEWKSKAEEATGPGGSSLVDLDKLINEVLLH